MTTTHPFEAPSTRAPAPARREAWQAARSALSAVLAHAAEVTVEEETPPSSSDGAGSRPVAQLRALLERTLELLGALDIQDGEAGDGEARHAVEDLCFAGSIELKRSLRARSASGRGDERAVAVESARRKVCRVVHAVLVASTDSSEGAEGVVAPAESLESAFAVRRAYAVFRRSLRRPRDESPEAVLEAARYAVGALAALVASPAYRDVRVQDRVILRGLRERALAWARFDKSSHEGLRLLGDVWTCADLLRGISRRQELQRHDHACLEALVAAPTGDAVWWIRCGELEGLDDELDRLLAQQRDAGTRDAVVARLVELVARDDAPPQGT